MGKVMTAPHGFGRTHPPPEDDDAQADSDFEDELIGLLARLEHAREALAWAAADRRVAQAVSRAAEMMDHVTDFSARHFPFAGPELRDGFARAAEFRAALEPLREPRPAAADGAARQALTARCFTALCDAVLAYFAAFTNRFPTSRAARGWVEVAATFAAELKRTARDVSSLA